MDIYEKVWYRYEAQSYSSVDEFDNVYTSSPQLRLDTFPVLSETPKGVWLDIAGVTRRFVLMGARKRWACPTEPEARESFIARKQRQIRILEAQLDRARTSLALAGDKSEAESLLVEG